MSGDLPEGVINADPPGGYEEAAVADRETAERNADSVDSPFLSESRLPPNSSGGTEPADVSPDVVESDAPSQGADSDLATDDEIEES